MTWFKQSLRHSRARSTGKAGPVYARSKANLNLPSFVLTSAINRPARVNRISKNNYDFSVSYNGWDDFAHKKYPQLQEKFIKSTASKHGFNAKKLSGDFKKGDTVYYFAYKINPI